MKNTLKIEQAHQLKKILILFLDLLTTTIIGVLLFFATFYPSYNNYSPYVNSLNYINETRKEYNLDEKLNYNLSFEHYEKYIKRIFEENYQTILNYYYPGFDLHDEEKNYGFLSDSVEYFYNITILGLPMEPKIEDFTSEDGYFKYQVNIGGEAILDEYGVGVSGLTDIEKRLQLETIYDKYSSIDSLFSAIDPTYVDDYNYISYMNSLAYTMSGVIAYAFYFMIIPLFRKNGETFISYYFKVGLVNKNGFKVKKYKILLRPLVFVPFIVLGLYFANIYTIIILLIAPFALDMLFMLISRENQDLMDLITKTLVVDTDKSYIFKDIYQEEEFFLKNPELEEEFMPEEIEYTNKLSNIREIDIHEEESNSTKNKWE